MPARSVLRTAFYVLVCFLILRVKALEVRPLPMELVRGLVSGTDEGYPELGSEFAGFRKYFTQTKRASFLTDNPFDSYDTASALHCTAQSYFIPMILNAEPDEKVALVYCSNHEIADERMRQTGYRLAAVESDGKGIAVKD